MIIMDKGIIIDTYDGFYFKTREIKEFMKYINLIDLNKGVKYIIDYIKKNEPSYIILPFSSILYNNPIPDLGIPILVGAGDPPRRLSSDYYKKYCKKNNISGVITHDNCVYESFKDYFSPMNIDIFVYKRGFDMDVLKDYKLNKDVDVSMTGKFSKYQHRKELHQLFSSINDFSYNRVRQDSSKTSKKDYEEYSKNINRSWFSIGGCLQERDICYYKGEFISDTFPKNIEIPASASCLLTTEWGDRKYLGFEDGKNCVLFNSVRDARRKVKYYLDDKDLLNNVIESGYKLVHKTHNVKMTISSLIYKIEGEYNG